MPPLWTTSVWRTLFACKWKKHKSRFTDIVLQWTQDLLIILLSICADAFFLNISEFQEQCSTLVSVDLWFAVLYVIQAGNWTASALWFKYFLYAFSKFIFIHCCKLPLISGKILCWMHPISIRLNQDQCLMSTSRSMTKRKRSAYIKRAVR